MKLFFPNMMLRKAKLHSRGVRSLHTWNRKGNVSHNLVFGVTATYRHYPVCKFENTSFRKDLLWKQALYMFMCLDGTLSCQLDMNPECYPCHQSLTLTWQRKLNMQPTEDTILVINALILPEMLRIPKPYRIFKCSPMKIQTSLTFTDILASFWTLRRFI